MLFWVRFDVDAFGQKELELFNQDVLEVGVVLVDLDNLDDAFARVFQRVRVRQPLDLFVLVFIDAVLGTNIALAMSGPARSNSNFCCPPSTYSSFSRCSKTASSASTSVVVAWAAFFSVKSVNDDDGGEPVVEHLASPSGDPLISCTPMVGKMWSQKKRKRKGNRKEKDNW